MPAFNPGQMQLPQVQNVVDVTYTLDGKNYTDTVDVTASIFSTRNPGSMTLVSTDKEAIVRELHATLKSSETYVKDAKRDVPKHEKRIKKCKSLIAQLDTEFKERQQTEERFSKLEESQQALDKKLDLILSRLPQK
jgi:seryl-tRNA synthetase